MSRIIGRYLETLTPFQEERVLTGTLRAGTYGPHCGGQSVPRCLVGLACSTERGLAMGMLPFPFNKAASIEPGVEFQFDALCRRFGVKKVGWAIRQRILRNMARRTLAGVVVRQEVMV